MQCVLTNVDQRALGRGTSSSQGCVQELDVGGLLAGKLSSVGSHGAVQAGLCAACEKHKLLNHCHLNFKEGPKTLICSCMNAMNYNKKNPPR